MERLPDGHSNEKSKIDEVFLKNLQDVLSQAYRKSESRIALYKSVSEFALGLEKKYPDARSRRLWHLLIGSTPKPEDENNVKDYPGDDSIIRFIERLNPEKD